MAEYYVYQKIQCVIVIISKFLQAKVARGLLSNLIRTKVPMLGIISILNTFFMYKTNARINKLLFAGDKFMKEMHLKLLAFIKGLVAHSTKIRKKSKNLNK